MPMRTRESTRIEYRMERLEGGRWWEMPYMVLSLTAHKERLALYRRENPDETYRLASRTVTVSSWQEVPE